MKGDTGREPKLLDQVRHRARALHMSLSTEKSYVAWIRRYILFHKKRHPEEMAESEINAFLTPALFLRPRARYLLRPRPRVGGLNSKGTPWKRRSSS